MVAKLTETEHAGLHAILPNWQVKPAAIHRMNSLTVPLEVIVVVVCVSCA